MITLGLHSSKQNKIFHIFSKCFIYIIFIFKLFILNLALLFHFQLFFYLNMKRKTHILATVVRESLFRSGLRSVDHESFDLDLNFWTSELVLVLTDGLEWCGLLVD